MEVRTCAICKGVNAVCMYIHTYVCMYIHTQLVEDMSCVCVFCTLCVNYGLFLQVLLMSTCVSEMFVTLQHFLSVFCSIETGHPTRPQSTCDDTLASSGVMHDLRDLSSKHIKADISPSHSEFVSLNA